jgi:energy-coupling factor transporter ATP-binding protein EcfA2
VITFDRATLTYPDALEPTLRDVTLHIPEGELALVVGRTGCGKSSLLRLVNGLAPTFTAGTLAGSVAVDGRDTRDHPPRELADVVGVVLQDPRQGFVSEIVEDEIAYGMESLGLPPARRSSRSILAFSCSTNPRRRSTPGPPRRCSPRFNGWSTTWD